MYEAAFRNIDDTLWKDAGCSSELDYIEQTSWVLFLKYLEDYESEKETAAILNGTTYKRIIDGEFAWIAILKIDVVRQVWIEWRINRDE
jgi:type I restriction enzyme M protein